MIPLHRPAKIQSDDNVEDRDDDVEDRDDDVEDEDNAEDGNVGNG